MAKRKAIPASTHFELTEYNSLIRALRTNNNLDVTSHLVRASSSHSSLRDEFDDSDNLSESPSQSSAPGKGGDVTDIMTDDALPSSGAYSRDISSGLSSAADDVELSARAGQKRKRGFSSPLQLHKQNIWTRWPLLIEDLHVPEWSFEDEIGLLASNALKVHPPHILPSTQSTDQAEDDEFENDDMELNSSSLSQLTDAASNYLSTILALITAHTPNHTQSMQNRVEPMNWLTVLNILSSSRNPSIADPNTVHSVQSRMEALLGRVESGTSENLPPLGSSEHTLDHNTPARRIRQNTEARKKLQAKLSDLTETLFVPPAPPA